MALTQRVVRLSALRPWRVLAAWGLVVVASVAAIATLLGSALSTDASITTKPDSVRADELLVGNFSQRNAIDEAVIIRSEKLTAEDPAFRTSSRASDRRSRVRRLPGQ